MRAFFSLCIAVAILALTPLAASALEVVVTNKYSAKGDPKGAWPYVTVYGNNNVQGGYYYVGPGKSVTVLKTGKATNVRTVFVSIGSGEFFFPMNIKGSKVIFHIVKSKRGGPALYSPQLKKTYSYRR